MSISVYIGDTCLIKQKKYHWLASSIGWLWPSGVRYVDLIEPPQALPETITSSTQSRGVEGGEVRLFTLQSWNAPENWSNLRERITRDCLPNIYIFYTSFDFWICYLLWNLSLLRQSSQRLILRLTFKGQLDVPLTVYPWYFLFFRDS